MSASVFGIDFVARHVNVPGKPLRLILKEVGPTMATASHSRHRDHEPTRKVIAVFFKMMSAQVRLLACVFVAVNQDGTVCELKELLNSPYAIRGRK